MRARSLAGLIVLAVLVVAGGWYFGTRTTPTEQPTISAGNLMFPDLAPRLPDATRIEITHQGSLTAIEKRPDGEWGVASMHDYPVQETKVRGLLTGLTELRLAETRTSDPDEYSRLGVDDPNAKGSSANLLRLLASDGKPLVAVIVGHRRVRGQANLPEEVYVRRPDESQSWLAEGSLQIDADPSLWLDRDILNIGHERIASVTSTRLAPGNEGQTLTFGMVDGKFALTQPADHPKLEDYKVDAVARGLEQLTFEAVRADADAPGTEAADVVFTTSDGLGVKITVLHADKADKAVWVRFVVAASEDKVKPEAERLTRRLAGWTYQISSWKEKSLAPALDDVKAEEPVTKTVIPGGQPPVLPVPQSAQEPSASGADTK